MSDINMSALNDSTLSQPLAEFPSFSSSDMDERSAQGFLYLTNSDCLEYTRQFLSENLESNSPIYSRSFISLLNDSDVIADLDMDYHLQNENALAVASLYGEENPDNSILSPTMFADSFFTDETPESPAVQNVVDNTIPNLEDEPSSSNDFSYVIASPDVFQNHFHFKTNSYPESSAGKPKMLELEDIMKLIINTASPQCTEGVSLLDSLSSIIKRLSIAEDSTNNSDSDECHLNTVSSPPTSDDISIDSEEVSPPSVNEHNSLNAEEGLLNFFTPARSQHCEFDHTVTTYTPEVGDIVKNEMKGDTRSILDDSLLCEQSEDISNSKSYKTPPTTLCNEDKWNSFLSSRSRKIARNMSASRRHKIHDKDSNFVQPKKLFLD